MAVYVAPGMRTRGQLLDLLGNIGEVIVLFEGRAWCVTNTRKQSDNSIAFLCYDRNGIHGEFAMGDHQHIYVTNRQRVNWPKNRPSQPDTW